MALTDLDEMRLQYSKLVRERCDMTVKALHELEPGAPGWADLFAATDKMTAEIDYLSQRIAWEMRETGWSWPKEEPVREG